MSLASELNHRSVMLEAFNHCFAGIIPEYCNVCSCGITGFGKHSNWACENMTLKNYSNKPTSAASVSLVSASDWSILGCLVTICQQREYAPVMKWTRIQVNIWHLYQHDYFTKIYAAVTMMEADTAADRVRGRTSFFWHTLW